jgi:molybdate transport system regulatory protein
MGVKVQFWLEKDGELILGSGRRDLLRMIRELGSLNRAAKTLSMSYRAAWGKIRDTERSLGWKLVEISGRRRHMTLTPRAEDLLERYRLFEEEASEAVRQVFRRRFPDGL